MAYQILQGDTREMLKTLPDESVQCIVTSPPYWGLRDYGVDGQIGMEPTYQEHVDVMVDVFRECWRVLRKDGTLWLNYGDCYASSPNGRSAADTKATGNDDRTFRDKPFSTVQGVLKPKDMVGMPWRVAFALQADGWWLRSDIVWSKPNPMPESISDRPTKAHEYLFLLAKSERYYYDHAAIQEPAISERGSGNGFVRPERLSMNGRGSDEPWSPKPQSRANFRRENSKRGIPQIGQNNGTHRPDRENTIPDGMRNKRDVWTVPTQPFPDAHFATFPPDLIRPCIRAGAPAGGLVLDPFNGAGTTGVVCIEEGRDYLGIEMNPEYVEMSMRRLQRTQPPLFALTGDPA